MFHPCNILLRIQRIWGKHVDPDEVAHDEPPHLELHCLLIHETISWHFKGYEQLQRVVIIQSIGTF